MSATVAALKFVMGADTAEFERSMKGVEDAMKRAAATGATVGTVIGNALVGAFHSLKESVHKALEAADRMDELSEMIGTTGVDAGETAPPNAIVLGNNLPNPFRDGTTIQYALPRTMAARLVVYDVAGHAVRTLVNGTQAAGERRVTWDGRNDSGSPVSRGVYLCRLEAGGMTQTRKMILH